LVFMAGDAVRRWTHPEMRERLRPVPHALVLPSSDDEHDMMRLWYGRMFFPTPDAIMPVDEKEDSSLVTFANVRAANVRSFLEERTSPRERGLSGNGCSGSEQWCWLQCMDASSFSCGTDEMVMCVDPSDAAVDCNDGTHHHGCELQCSSSSGHDHGATTDNSTTSSDSANDFCSGSGVSMYMMGFDTFIEWEDENPECVNLWFESWTLNSRGKFSVACLGIFSFGIAVEGLRYVQKEALRRRSPAAVRIALRGIQVAAGYLIMLVTMLYQAELFVMVVLGLTTGWAIFHMQRPIKGEDDVDEATDDVLPCCSGSGGSPETMGHSTIVPVCADSAMKKNASASVSDTA